MRDSYNLWLLNKDGYIKDQLDLIKCNHKIELNGKNVLNFKTTSKVEKLDIVLYKDKTSKWHEFIVQGVTEDRYYIIGYAEHISYELHDMIIRDKRPSGSPLVHLNQLLQGTRWKSGNVEIGESLFLNYYYKSVYSSIAHLVTSCGGEVQFRTEIDSSGKVIGRFVDILRRVGRDTGFRFEYSKDLESVTRKVLDDGVYTALIGRGRGEEIGNGYGRRITFESLNKPDSPTGVDYVYDQTSLNMWGLTIDGTKINRIGVVEFDDIGDPEMLYEETKKSLQNVKTPKINYSVEVLLLTDDAGVVSIGDSVSVIDKDFHGDDLRFTSRVIELKRDLVDVESSEVTLGQPLKTLSDSYIQTEDKLNSFSSKVPIWDKIASAFDNGKLDASYVDNLLSRWNQLANATGGFVYFEDGEGITTYDKPIDENPTMATQIVGGTIRFANSKLENGDWEWRTVINSDGIVGSEIAANSITVDKISSDFGAGLDLSSNTTITQTISNHISEYNTTLNTRLEQTSAGWNYIFEALKNDVNTNKENTTNQFNLFSRYIRMIAGTLILGEINNPFEIHIDNQEIGFYQNGLRVAYIKSNQLFIENGEFVQVLKIGNFAFKPRDNGNLSFGKV